MHELRMICTNYGAVGEDIVDVLDIVMGAVFLGHPVCHIIICKKVTNVIFNIKILCNTMLNVYIRHLYTLKIALELHVEYTQRRLMALLCFFTQ